MEFIKRVVEKGDVKQKSVSRRSETDRNAAKSGDCSARTMRTYEESQVPEDVMHSVRAAALSERPIERKTHPETSKANKVQAYGQVSLDARESNAEKKAAGRFIEDRAVWRDELQRHRKEACDNVE